MSKQDRKSLAEDAARWRFIERRHETISDAEQTGDSSDVWCVHHGYDPVGCSPGELRQAVDQARAKEAAQ